MSVPIAVSPTVVRYRRDLLDALQASGFSPDQPPDIFAWARRGSRRAIILTVSTRKELTAVARLQNRSEAVAVVLLADPRPSAYRQVLAAGGFPVAWHVPPAGVVGVLEAAINGQALVARRVATGVTTGLASNAAPDDRAARDGAAQPGGSHPLDETELDILARVARGDTDRRIATALRVSERTVRRRLHLIFSKLGVVSRVQAGIYAAKIGLAGPDALPLRAIEAKGGGPTVRGG
ncbi:MAG TPA: LuxR C-terminal-related transcriptional regulator [Actinomycetota bacterium]